MLSIRRGHTAGTKYVNRSVLLEFRPYVRYLLLGQHPMVSAPALVIQTPHAVESIPAAPAQQYPTLYAGDVFYLPRPIAAAVQPYRL